MAVRAPRDDRDGPVRRPARRRRRGPGRLLGDGHAHPRAPAARAPRSRTRCADGDRSRTPRSAVDRCRVAAASSSRSPRPTGTGFTLTARRDGAVVGELHGMDRRGVAASWRGCGSRTASEASASAGDCSPSSRRGAERRGADRLVAAIAPTTSELPPSPRMARRRRGLGARPVTRAVRGGPRSSRARRAASAKRWPAGSRPTACTSSRSPDARSRLRALADEMPRGHDRGARGRPRRRTRTSRVVARACARRRPAREQRRLRHLRAASRTPIRSACSARSGST